MRLSVFCVLTMEIMEGVVSYVTDEGVRVHGASHEEFVCEVVDKLAVDLYTYVPSTQILLLPVHRLSSLQCPDKR
jgi:DNA-directed RNA polymerase subunit E'/Rpb7